MKFFSTALAAFAVGSAVAAPVLEARTAPCPCSGTDKTGVDVPNVDVPSTCGPGGIKTPIKNLPSTGDVISVGADVVVVVDTVVKAVVEVEANVQAHLEAIAAITAKADIDVEALLKIIVDLHLDLDILNGCAPQLDGLVIDADVFVAAELQVVLDLMVRVQALIAKVEVSLAALVKLDAKILAVIGVEVKACLDLIVVVTTPIVNFALAIVAKLSLVVDVQVIVGQISDCADKITNTCGLIGGLLGTVASIL